MAAIILKFEDELLKLPAEASARNLEVASLSAKLAEFKDNTGGNFISQRALDVFVKMRLQHRGNRRMDPEEIFSSSSSSAQHLDSQSSATAVSPECHSNPPKDATKSGSEQKRNKSVPSSVQQPRKSKGIKKNHTLISNITKYCTSKDQKELKRVKCIIV